MIFPKPKRNLFRKSFDSAKYWNRRYGNGGNSGDGSRGEILNWKADQINSLISELGCRYVIDFGCGDGVLASLLKVESYLGLDVSENIILKNAATKKDNQTFEVYGNRAASSKRYFGSDLSLSVDVILHLIEEHIYNDYMLSLFFSTQKYVLIFNTNTKIQIQGMNKHNKFRNHQEWVEQFATNFRLKKFTPYDLGDSFVFGETGFFLYERN